MSDTINFIGSTHWQAVELPKWTLGGYGEDRASVLYRGRRPLKDAFLNQLRKWSTMPGFSGMSYEDATEGSGTPNFPGVELRYVGFRDGTIPPVKAEDDRSLQNVSTSMTIQNEDEEDEELTFSASYYAPSTNYRWFETQTPAEQPRYNSVRSKTSPLDTLFNIRTRNATTGGTISLGQFTELRNTLTRGTRVSGYRVDDLIPGKLWACSATVESVLEGA